MSKYCPRMLIVQSDQQNLLEHANSLNVEAEIYACLDCETALGVLSCTKIDIAYLEQANLASQAPTTRLAQAIKNHYPTAKICSFNDLASKKKSGGKNTNQIHFIGEMTEVLKYGKFDLVFQAISRCSKKRGLLGTEALARVSYEGFAINPEVLFAVANQKNRIFEIEFTCIRQVLNNIKKQYFTQNQCLFLNIRPQTLAQPAFVPELLRILNASQISAKSIIFELTEQQAILNMEAVLEAVSLLRSHQIAVAIDDFGVGFSNFSLFYQTKPEYLKISGFFSKNLSFDKEKQALVRCMVKIAKTFNATTILECVESQEDFDAAIKLGVDYAQGYFIGKPGLL